MNALHKKQAELAGTESRSKQQLVRHPTRFVDPDAAMRLFDPDYLPDATSLRSQRPCDGAAQRFVFRNAWMAWEEISHTTSVDPSASILAAKPPTGSNLVPMGFQRHGACLVSLHILRPSRSTHWGRHKSKQVSALLERSPGTLIIAGGSSGIGRCTAALFARHGWRVGLIARGEAGLTAAAATVRAAGVPVAVAMADVTISAALRDAADAIVAELGPPDVWINCAGNGVYGRFVVTPEAQFERVTAVTYGGTVNGCRVALALMTPQGQGTIVNVCSAVAFHGVPLMTSYAGAKAAVRGFGQALQAELRMERSRIRVSTVFPPAVNTPFFSHSVSHMGWPARPIAPVYQPEIVAAAIHLAALRGAPEMVVSGTATTFSIAARVSPRLIAFAMTRLGFDSQLTDDPEVTRLEQPTLFAPSAEAYPVHGPFGRHARQRSLQVWLCRHRRALLGLGLLAGAVAVWVTHGSVPP